MTDRIRGFICYSHKDRKFFEELRTHLKTLELPADFWDDQEITAGDDWNKEIFAQLTSAHVILLLVSVDFIASNYINTVELQQAMLRMQRGEARVIPIVLRRTRWEHTPYHALQALPSEAKPVTEWSNRDEAFTDIVNGIADALQKMQEERAAAVASGGLIAVDVLHKALLSLDYSEQVRAFRKVRDNRAHVGAFLIQGELDCGQSWLLHRLIYISRIENADRPPFKFTLTRRSVGLTLGKLWFSMGKWLDAKNSVTAPGPLVEQVYALWQRQSVILILDDIDGATEEYIQEVLQKFWEPLMRLVGQARELPKHYLLLFLVDPVGNVESWNIRWAEQLDTPVMPVKLKKIREITREDVERWIDGEVNNLPSTLTAEQVLAQGGTPLLVLQQVCKLCGYEWYEQESAWL